MNKSKIDWCDYTWNPVTGCFHGCEYCYARKIDKRFGDGNFTPTFHPERLQEPLKVKKPSKIFVGSVSDLFGDWFWQVSKEPGTVTSYNMGMVVGKILDVVKQCPQHTFIFLTKNPKGMQGFNFPSNCLCGTSVEDQEKANERIPELLKVDCKTLWASYEPSLGKVDFGPWIRKYYHGGIPGLKRGEKLLPPSITGKPTLLQYAQEIAPDGPQRADKVYFTTDKHMANIFSLGYPMGDVYRAIPESPVENDPDCNEPEMSFQSPSGKIVSDKTPLLKWIVIGAQTGPGAVKPKSGWINSAAEQVKAANVPVFIKDNAADYYWGELLPREFPGVMG